MDETLQHFTPTRGQDAFRRLVEQHINLVYAAARRQLRDATTAQDVTQAVFILLSQKAARLADAPMLTGWLLRTTYFICKDVQKRENRRRFHETQAAIMRQRQATDEAEQSDGIQAVLDAAMMRLGDRDRSAVALRFLEDRPLKDVGRMLGVSEEAARKQVERALRHLRQAMGAEGVTAPAVLGTALAAKGIEIAPAAVSAAVLAPATINAAGMASAGAKLLLWMQVKLAATAAAAIIILSTVTIAIAAAAFHSPGPPPMVMAALPAGPPATSPGALPKPGDPVIYRGQLVDPTGKPVANAAIRVYLHDNPNLKSEWQGQTGPDGTFAVGPLTSEPEATQRIILFDAPGQALTWWDTDWNGPLGDNSSIRVETQARTQVSGKVTDAGGKPIPNALVEAELHLDSHGWFYLNAGTKLSVTTDAAGAFHWDRIPQGARLDLTVHHPDFCTWSTDMISNGESPVAAGTTDIEIQLNGNPATIHAQLTKGGQPAAEAGHLLAAVSATKASEYQQTDAQGRADFHGLPPGTWQIRNPYSLISGKSLAIPQFDISLEAGQQRDVSMAWGNTPVHGQALEPGTTRPSHQLITLSLAAGDRGLGFVTPDAQGRFEFSLPPGAYTLHSSSWDSWEKDGFKKVSQDFTIPNNVPDVALNISVREPPALHGQLVDAQGKPLSGYVVLENRRSIFAGPDGRFSLGNISQPLYAGEQLIGVAIDLNRTVARGFVVDRPAPDTPDLRLVLEPMATIIGQAVDRAGRPLPQTSVQPSIVSDHNGMYSTNGWISKTTLSETAAFRSTSVPVGYRMRLLLELDGMQADIPLADLQPGETRDVGQVVLHRPGAATRPANPSRNSPPLEPWDATITGRLLDESGKPVVGCSIEANANELGRNVPENLEASGISDLKGRFTITSLPRNRPIQLQINLHEKPYSWSVIPSPNPVELQLSAAARPSDPNSLPPALPDRLP